MPVEAQRQLEKVQQDPTSIFRDGVQALRNGDYRQAERLLRIVVTMAPADTEALWRLASAVGMCGDTDEAIAVAKQAIRYDPACAQAHGVLGGAYVNLGRFTEAHAHLNRALQLHPHMAAAHYNRSYANLATGNWLEGWLDYEWGLVTRNRRMRTLAAPSWDGRPNKGGTLFIWGEQGLGDQIMYARFVKRAKEQWKGRVVLEVLPPLAQVMSIASGADDVYAAAEDGSIYEDIDANISLCSLPLVMGVATDKEVSDNAEYMRGIVSPMKLAEDFFTGKVACSWSGSRTHNNDRWRTIPHDDFKLLQQSGLDFIAMQHNDGVLPFPMENVGQSLTDFTQTVAILQQTLCTVTCDTALAHISATMGCETWLIAPATSEYRWMTKETKVSPWYPNVKIFRPTIEDGFAPAVKRVAKELKKKYGNRLHSTPNDDAGGKPADERGDNADAK